jgi:hypothetical protein
VSPVVVDPLQLLPTVMKLPSPTVPSKLSRLRASGTVFGIARIVKPSW